MKKFIELTTVKPEGTIWVNVNQIVMIRPRNSPEDGTLQSMVQCLGLVDVLLIRGYRVTPPASTDTAKGEE